MQIEKFDTINLRKYNFHIEKIEFSIGERKILFPNRNEINVYIIGY